MLKFVVAASLAIASASFLFSCNETFSHHGERSLLCVILMGDTNVEILCWYDNVYLVRIDKYDNTMSNVHIGTPAQVYTLDITNDNLSCED